MNYSKKGIPEVRAILKSESPRRREVIATKDRRLLDIQYMAHSLELNQIDATDFEVLFWLTMCGPPVHHTVWFTNDLQARSLANPGIS